MANSKKWKGSPRMRWARQLLESLVLTTALWVVATSIVLAQAQQCPGLRALDGTCANVAAVEIARRRAMILSSQRVSYFGTPAGTVGGQFIPFERLFRDDPLLFGLPTVTSIAVDIDFRATVTRTK
jgi:hypothetical protein